MSQRMGMLRAEKDALVHHPCLHFGGSLCNIRHLICKHEGLLIVSHSHKGIIIDIGVQSDTFFFFFFFFNKTCHSLEKKKEAVQSIRRSLSSESDNFLFKESDNYLCPCTIGHARASGALEKYLFFFFFMKMPYNNNKTKKSDK